MRHFYPTIALVDNRVTLKIHECRLMYESESVTYISGDGHGWRRHDGPLFADRDEAVVHGIFLLRGVCASCENGIDTALEELK